MATGKLQPGKTAAVIADAQAAYLDDPESQVPFQRFATWLNLSARADFTLIVERVDSGDGEPVVRLCATAGDFPIELGPLVWEPGDDSAIGCALRGVDPGDCLSMPTLLPPPLPQPDRVRCFALGEDEDIVGVMIIAGGAAPSDVKIVADAIAGMLRHRRVQCDRSNELLRALHGEKQLSALLDSVMDGIVTIDEDGVVDSVNAAATRIFGYTKREVVGRNVNMLMPEPHRSQHNNYLRHYRRTGEARLIGFGRELDGQRKDGSIFPLDLSISEIQIGERRRFVGVMRDVSEHRRRQEAVERMRASHQNLELLVRVDPLTGIANRRHFDEALTQEIHRAARYGRFVSLLMCDVDHFKDYNDTYGHLAGDECLQKLARALDLCFQRAGELVARFGGEEFVVILPSLDAREAHAAAEAACAEVRNLSLPHAGSSCSERVSISVGVATRRPDRRYEPQALIRAADEALYRAKHNGRDRVESALPGAVPATG